MAYCPKCGTKSPDEAKFCNVCGTSLTQVEQTAQAPQPQQPPATKTSQIPPQQPVSPEQPIKPPFPQQPPPSTVRQLPPQNVPPYFNPVGQPTPKRRWKLVGLGLLIVLAGLYYIGSGPEAVQPAPVQPVTRSQDGSPLQKNPLGSQGQPSPQAPAGTEDQQPGSQNIVGRQAKIAYLEKTDQQVSSIMQGVARGAGPEALNEISQVIEDINQTTLDNDEDENALELLVLEISRLGCACSAITEPDKKETALQEESRLRQEFVQKFQAYKQGTL